MSLSFLTASFLLFLFPYWLKYCSLHLLAGPLWGRLRHTQLMSSSGAGCEELSWFGIVAIVATECNLWSPWLLSRVAELLVLWGVTWQLEWFCCVCMLEVQRKGPLEVTSEQRKICLQGLVTAPVLATGETESKRSSKGRSCVARVSPEPPLLCPQSHPCCVSAQLNPSSRNSVETKTSSRQGINPQNQQPPPKIHQIPNPQRAPSEVMLLPWGWVKIPQPGASLDVTAPFPQDEFKFSYTAESPAWDLFFWAVTPDHFVLHNGNMVHSFWLLPGRSCVESGPISCWFSVLLLPISKWKTELIPISHPPPCNCPHRLSTSPQTPMASDCHWGCVGWCETFPASVLTYCSADSRSHQNPPLEHSPLQILIAVDSWELDGIWWF